MANPKETIRGAVDNNRPSDLVGQTAPADMADSRVQPNVLQRQNVIVPEDRIHVDTAGEELAEDLEEQEDALTPGFNQPGPGV